MTRASTALNVISVLLVLAACGGSDDDAAGGVDSEPTRPSLPTSVTTSGAGETAMLNGELYLADRTLPASALSAERLESVGEAETGGQTFTLARARADEVEPWERVSAAPDGWRVWQPMPVLRVLEQAGAGAMVLEAERVDFPDACLGAAEPGEVCAAVITPGYRVIVEQNGARTEYRVSTAGHVRPVG